MTHEINSDKIMDFEKRIAEKRIATTSCGILYSNPLANVAQCNFFRIKIARSQKAETVVSACKADVTVEPDLL